MAAEIKRWIAGKPRQNIQSGYSESNELRRPARLVYGYGTASPCLRWFDDYLYVLIERGEKPHEPLDREPLETTA